MDIKLNQAVSLGFSRISCWHFPTNVMVMELKILLDDGHDVVGKLYNCVILVNKSIDDLR